MNFLRMIYDVVDGEVLFSSDDKYDSGCGWPAFSKPFNEDVITKNRDFSHGTTRIEVRSKMRIPIWDISFMTDPAVHQDTA